MVESIDNKDRTPLKAKDFVSSSEVRWCPGCGDYAILAALQKALPDLGIQKENVVIISGIGCSSRFPYYMNTYGFHTIHGRGPAVVTGLKVANPDLSVWLITGDGDGLSIGGNHLMHLMRRNINVNVLLFNNRIYGLTKGQFSPTSEEGKKTKTSPLGTIENPVSPLEFALASQSSFIARTYDANLKHMIEIFKEAEAHQGTSFVEIWQNCVIFNKDTFHGEYSKDVRDDRLVHLVKGQEAVYGKEEKKYLEIKQGQAKSSVYKEGEENPNILVHNIEDKNSAYTLAGMGNETDPFAMGVIYAKERHIYEDVISQNTSIEKRDDAHLETLFKGRETWVVTENEQAKMELQKGTLKNLTPEDIDIKLMKERIKKRGYTSALGTKLYDLLKSGIARYIEEYAEANIELSLEDSIYKAVKVLKDQKLAALAVTHEGICVGILTERDIVLKVFSRSLDSSSMLVSEVMTPINQAMILNRETRLARVINRLIMTQVTYLPIEIEKGKYVVISARTILDYVLQSLKEEIKE